MKDTERLLKLEKESMNQIKAPDNLEEKLKEALEDIKPRKKRAINIKIASLIIAVLILGYNMDTLAQYGKRLIGYENVMNGTIKELNQLGKGQIIDKSYEFQGGDKISVDALMLDDNNMVLFYSLYSPSGNVENLYNDLYLELKGMGGRRFSLGGSGQSTEDGKYMNWVMSTRETPKIFEKSLKLKATLYNDKRQAIETAEIGIKIDRKQAVGKSIRMNINKKVKVEDKSLKVESLVASPISTVVKGRIQNIVELAFDTLTENRIMPYDINLLLIADGKEIARQGSSISTNMKGIRFEIEYEALPKDIKSLELKLTSLNGDFDVKSQVDLAANKNKTISIRGNHIEIKNIYQEDKMTYIDISTEESVGLGKVYLYIDGQKVEVEEVIAGDYEKIVNGNHVEINYTRTFSFKGVGEDLVLEIGRIRYNKIYNQTIYK